MIIVSLAVSLPAMLGVLMMQAETDPVILFTPEGSRAHRDNAKYIVLLPKLSNNIVTYNVIISHPSLDLLIEDKALNAIESFDATIRADRGYFNWCRKAWHGSCNVYSVLEAAAQDGTAAAAKVNTLCSPTYSQPASGQLLLTRQITSGTTADDNVQCPSTGKKMARAAALKVTYASGPWDKVQGEVEWLSKIGGEKLKNELGSGYTVGVSNGGALNRELERSILGDVHLFVSSILLIASFCQVGLHTSLLLHLLLELRTKFCFLLLRRCVFSNRACMSSLSWTSWGAGWRWACR